MQKIVLTLTGILVIAKLHAQCNQLIIGDNSNGQVVSSTLTGSNLDTFDLGGVYHSFYDADDDYVNKKIYMAWYYGIYRMNYDGSGFDTIFDYPAGGYSAGIAVDNVNGHVYWGNSPDGKIIRADLDGSNQVDVLTGLGYVRDVDIDVENGLIFFGQTIFTGSKGLYKANMDGTGLTALMPSTDPTSLGLDIKNEKVYYQDVTEMRRINYDGTSDISIAYNSPTGFFVDTVNSYVFVGHNVLNKISRMDLDGSNAVDLITSGLDSPHGPLIIGQVINENITVIGLTLTANQTGATYQWVDCDNAYMPIPGETFQSFTASANGNYAVEVYVDSCMVRSACVNINTVGITNEVGYRQQLMYPNPFSDRLYINPTEKVKVQLFNMFGELVGYYDCAEGRMEIIFPGLPKGLYLLQLSGQNNTQVFHVVRD